MKIVSRSSMAAIDRYLDDARVIAIWAEVCRPAGEVYHPSTVIQRTETAIRSGAVNLCTMSEIPILTACRMMRLGRLPEV